MMSCGTAWLMVRALCDRSRGGARGGNYCMMVNYLVLVAVRDRYEVCCVQVGLRE